MIKEDSVAADAAQVSEPIGKTCRGLPCFDVDSSDELHSFHKGIKKFHLWKKHTKSEEIRKWAKNNPGKSFVVHHNGNYIKIHRGKDKGILKNESFTK